MSYKTCCTKIFCPSLLQNNVESVIKLIMMDTSSESILRTMRKEANAAKIQQILPYCALHLEIVKRSEAVPHCNGKVAIQLSYIGRANEC